MICQLIQACLSQHGRRLREMCVSTVSQAEGTGQCALWSVAETLHSKWQSWQNQRLLPQISHDVQMTTSGITGVLQSDHVCL